MEKLEEQTSGSQELDTMTKREFFAAFIMAGLSIGSTIQDGPVDAKMAVDRADDLIEALNL